METNNICLANLEQATAQEVFNQVARHLLKQKKKSIIRDKCFYRGEDGLACAAGCLISDEEYKAQRDASQYGNKFEDAGSWSMLVTNDLVPNKHSHLICRLQTVHDRSAISDWKARLWEVAKEFGLDDSVLGTKQ